MIIQYRATNLAELLESVQNIVDEASAAEGRHVGPDEILINSGGYIFVEFTAKSSTLTDNSVVYDVEF